MCFHVIFRTFNLRISGAERGGGGKEIRRGPPPPQMLRFLYFARGQRRARKASSSDEAQGSTSRTKKRGEAPARSCVDFSAFLSFSCHGLSFKS